MKTAAAALRITRLSVSALVLSTPLASADPIPVTSGSMVATVENGFHILLSGPDGFRITSSGAISGGRLAPFEQCRFAPYCSPGSEIDLLAGWSGSDFQGSVTIDGTTHPMGLGSESVYSAVVEFTGAVAAPAFDGTLVREVAAPFAFAGTLIPPFAPDQGPSWRLTGAGTATLRLSWSSDPSLQGWIFERAVYSFEPPAPVPEPGTIALLGFGLSTLLSRRLRSHPRASLRRLI